VKIRHLAFILVSIICIMATVKIVGVLNGWVTPLGGIPGDDPGTPTSVVTPLGGIPGDDPGTPT
jgi:hypothetical protein